MVNAIVLLIWGAGAHAAQGDRDRAVADLILEGDCDQALSKAVANLASRSGEAGAHRDLGDAWRCGRDDIQALAAYRDALALTPDDRSLQRVVKTLAATKGRLEVTVQGVDPGKPAPWFDVVSASHRHHSWRRVGDTWYFQDLPAGEPLRLEVAGPGVPAASYDVAVLDANRDTALEIAIVQAAVTRVTLEPWTAALKVAQIDGGFQRPVQPGPLDVTPGKVHLAITTERGTITELFDAPYGQAVSIDVDTLIPGAVSLVGVPVGTTVRWPVGPERESSRTWDGPQGKTDLDVGFPLLKPVLIDEVRSGSQTLRLDHPVLGSMSTNLVVVGGEVSNLRVDVEAFPRAPELKTAYAVWKNEDFLARATPEVTRRARQRKALAIMGGGVALAGVARLGTAVSDRNNAFEAYNNANDIGDTSSAALHYDEADSAVAKAQRGAVVFVGGAAMTTVGISLTVHELRLTRARRATRPWVPEDVLRGQVGPAASLSAEGDAGSDVGATSEVEP
jgi:hypothetical protein